MSDPETVRVPWIVGTVAGAVPALPPAAEDRKARCARKVAQIEADIGPLLKGLGNLPQRRREAVSASIGFQRRRLEWLKAGAETPRERLERRLAVIMADLGEDGRRFLAQGLPEALARDQRFMDLLGEAAILQYLLEAG